MGKTRRSKAKPTKDNPTGLPSVRDVSLEEELLGDDDVQSRSLQTIIDQVQASNVEDKLCGLQTLAFLSERPEVLGQVLESGIARIVSPLLVDPSSDVRNAASGALRNISLSGVLVCDILVEQDILTPLFALLQQYSDDWCTPSPANRDVNAIPSSKEDTFIQSVHLVWNLCENSSRALELFTKSNLLPTLARALNVEQYGLDIAITVAQCLQVVTEDNPEAVELIRPFTCLLDSIIQLPGHDPQIVFLRTLTAGIIMNISSPPLANILMVLSAALSIDSRCMVSEVSSSLPLKDYPEEPEPETGQMDTESAPKAGTKDSAKLVASIQNMLKAQKCAVEILTNICSLDLDDMDCDSETSGNSEDDDLISESSSIGVLGPDRLPVELLELLTSLDLLDNVWKCTRPLPENVHNLLNESPEGRTILQSAWKLRSSALLCLNNLCAFLPLEQLGGANALCSVWLEMGRNVFGNSTGNSTGSHTGSDSSNFTGSSTGNSTGSDSRNSTRSDSRNSTRSDSRNSTGNSNRNPTGNSTGNFTGNSTGTPGQESELLEASTALMRAVLERLADVVMRNGGDAGNLFAEVSESDVQLMLDGEKHCMSIETRANWLRMLGLFGRLLPIGPQMRKIAVSLLEVCAKEGQPWPLAEALDSLVDMFSEDDTDTVAMEIGLVEKLAGLSGCFKNKIRQHKRSLDGRLAPIQTINQNLTRFIKYKRSRLASIKS